MSCMIKYNSAMYIEIHGELLCPAVFFVESNKHLLLKSMRVSGGKLYEYNFCYDCVRLLNKKCGTHIHERYTWGCQTLLDFWFEVTKVEIKPKRINEMFVDTGMFVMLKDMFYINYRELYHYMIEDIVKHESLDGMEAIALRLGNGQSKKTMYSIVSMDLYHSTKNIIYYNTGMDFVRNLRY